jgi:hypothetical protein
MSCVGIFIPDITKTCNEEFQRIEKVD